MHLEKKFRTLEPGNSYAKGPKQARRLRTSVGVATPMCLEVVHWVLHCSIGLSGTGRIPT